MTSKFQIGGARWNAWMTRQSRIGRLCVRAGVPFILAIVLLNLHIVRTLDIVIIVFASLILAPLLPILAYRWITRRVLWKVRNRLILSYLLMGLAPVVLFGTLGGIAAYVFTGQYATNTALTILDDASTKLKEESASEAEFSLSDRSLSTQSHTGKSAPAAPQRSSAFAGSPVTVMVQDAGHWRTLISPATAADSPLPLLVPGQAPPAWLKPSFHGVVLANGRLFLCSETSVQQGSNTVPVLASMTLDEHELGKMAKGLGTISILRGFSRLQNNAANDDDPAPAPKPAPTTPPGDPQKITLTVAGKPKLTVARNNDEVFSSVKGGKLPPAAHFFDTPVYFTEPLTITSWDTGETEQTIMTVSSRPTLLYAKLFATSADIGTLVRVILISVAIFFAALQLIALLMALKLSRTITRSVSDLYRGTREIDAGNLDHRIRVARHDQLGSLASSFNGMAASVSHLLQQQREKERLLNELKIAQEVQTTLFPNSPALLGGLEMHALCIPASTVGGDYYDFIFGSHSGLCLALGDISGKGISAALLMASLHSAVRAFSLGEDTDQRTQPSPALLLKLLNRHLYLSTQSARYATLFLAFYDVKTHRLTYSNGGHLPPLLLSTDGKVRRLDCGGSVVGLLDDLDYVEETVQMEPGDLLIAFTDGLTEPENASGEFGEARLLELMRQHRDEPLPTLAANTLTVIKQWIGNQDQPDDMTILLARHL
jgi:sigma-B regulation protein RsbU (phosphoserine phosphatase)